MKSLSLKMKLIVYNIIISLVICMLLGGFSYFLMVNTMTNNTIKQTNMILDQTTKSIDYSASVKNTNSHCGHYHLYKIME